LIADPLWDMAWWNSPADNSAFSDFKNKIL
jgi:hypothetical protein